MEARVCNPLPMEILEAEGLRNAEAKDRFEFVRRVSKLRQVVAELETLPEARETDHALVRELDRRLTELYEDALEHLLWARAVKQ